MTTGTRSHDHGHDHAHGRRPWSALQNTRTTTITMSEKLCTARTVRLILPSWRFSGTIVNVYGPRVLRYERVCCIMRGTITGHFSGVHQLMGRIWGQGAWKKRQSRMVFIGISNCRKTSCAKAWSRFGLSLPP